jgi:pre-mRNA-splicing factor CWC26
MSSSKLDYLSKYYSSASSDHKSKKKEKKRSRSDHREVKTVHIVDEPCTVLHNGGTPYDSTATSFLRDDESWRNNTSQSRSRRGHDSAAPYNDDDVEEDEADDGDGPLVVHMDNSQLPECDEESTEMHPSSQHLAIKRRSKRRYDSDEDNTHGFEDKRPRDVAPNAKSRRYDSDDEQEHSRPAQPNNTTVYRDEHGKKLDMKKEQEKYDKAVRETLELSQKQKLSLNMGGAQKAQILERNQQWEDIQQSSFARGIDDKNLEEWKRNQIREGDPMAAYSNPTIPPKGDGLQHPRYKGPKPKPNRFLIPPGYRWDGVDRGNGFEDLVLAKMFSKGQEKEEAYKRSTADM